MIITRTKKERKMKDTLATFETLINRLERMGYSTSFYKAKLNSFINIGNALSRDDYERTPYGRRLKYTSYFSIEHQYDEAIELITRYTNNINDGLQNHIMVYEEIKEMEQNISYNMQEDKITDYISKCSKFLYYPLDEEHYLLLVENIYKLIKIEIQRNYGTTMLESLIFAIKPKVDIYSMFNRRVLVNEYEQYIFNLLNNLVLKDLEILVDCSCDAKDTMKTNNYSIFNIELLKTIAEKETGDYTSLQERIAKLEEEICLLEGTSQKEIKLDIFDKLYYLMHNGLIDKKYRLIKEKFVNLGHIDEGIYILPVMYFKNSSSKKADYKYDYKDSFARMDIILCEDEEVDISESHILVNVDKSKPNSVTEVLTGIEIPVTFNYKVKLFDSDFVKNEIVSSGIPPVTVFVDVDVNENKKGKFDSNIRFKNANNINIMNCSEEKKNYIFDRYKFYHSDILGYSREFEDGKIMSLKEYYRYLKKRCQNYRDMSNSNIDGRQLVKSNK